MNKIGTLELTKATKTIKLLSLKMRKCEFALGGWY